MYKIATPRPTEESNKQVNVVNRFEYLSCTYPRRSDPIISPTPRPTSASRQFFYFYESDQPTVNGFAFIESVIIGTKIPA